MLIEEGLLLQLKSPRVRIRLFIDKIVETRLDIMYLIDCVTLKSPLTKKIDGKKMVNTLTFLIVVKLEMTCILCSRNDFFT